LGEEYRSHSSSLCNLLHSPVTSSLLGPNVILSAIFSNTLSFLSSPALQFAKYVLRTLCTHRKSQNFTFQRAVTLYFQYSRGKNAKENDGKASARIAVTLTSEPSTF